MIAVAFDPIYVLPLPENHRFPMEKYDLLPKQLVHEGTCDPDNFFSPQTLDEHVVKAIHQKDYVNGSKGSLRILSPAEICKAVNIMVSTRSGSVLINFQGS